MKCKFFVYIGVMIVVFIISCIYVFDNVGMILSFIVNIVYMIFFYNLGIGWIVLVIIGGIIGYFIL